MTTAIDTAMGTAKEAFGNATNVAKGAAEDAASAVKDTADDAAKTAKKLVSFLTHLDMDDVLGLVGLRRKRSPLVAIALIGGGVLVGAGITLLLAPASGREAREQLRKLFGNLGTKAMEEAKEVKGIAEDVKHDVQARAGQIASDVKGRAGDVVGDVKEKVYEAKERVGEIVSQVAEGETAQSEDTAGDERKARRRHNNAQVS